MIRACFPLLALPMLLSACETTRGGERRTDVRLERALAGKVAGEPRDCLSTFDTRSSATYDGAILYRVNRKLTYVNDLQQCPALREDRIPVFQIFGNQQCRGDIVRMIDRSSGFELGSCVVGKFVPYRTPS